MGPTKERKLQANPLKVVGRPSFGAGNAKRGEFSWNLLETSRDQP